ncbi:MAG: hypothetical protein KAU20_03845 [Nanoarchaeota archaeon]|nr:hypothetical protein [Nanoarchaeota archaeon]
MTGQEKIIISQETGIPVSSLDMESDKAITYQERDLLMPFNTKLHWSCFYDPETGKLYNEYCRLIDSDAKSYLVGIGLLTDNNEAIKYFEK